MTVGHQAVGQRQSADTRSQLYDMVKDIKFAMFTTRHPNGHLHARPMTTQNKALDADDSLWFFMSKKGDPLDDLKTNPVVAVIYADPSSDTYVSVSGTAAMLEDAAKKLADHAVELVFRRLVGEVVVQRLASRRETEHRHQHDTRDHDQPCGHCQADGSDQENRRNGRDARRQHIPDEHVLDREHRIRCGGMRLVSMPGSRSTK